VIQVSILLSVINQMIRNVASTFHHEIIKMRDFVTSASLVCSLANASARMAQHEGNNKSNQLINRVFDTIHSGKDTVKRWHCYNSIELWLRIWSRAISVFIRGTSWFR